jgi:hypothetical protein
MSEFGIIGRYGDLEFTVYRKDGASISVGEYGYIQRSDFKESIPEFARSWESLQAVVDSFLLEEL